MKFDFGDILKNGQGVVLHLKRLVSRGSSKICRNCMGYIIERRKIRGCTTPAQRVRQSHRRGLKMFVKNGSVSGR